MGELWLSASHILRELLAPSSPGHGNASSSSSSFLIPPGLHESDPDRMSLLGDDRKRLLIVMVGLPARGKSFISHRLTNYLTWYGLRTKVFNVGAYRRAVGGNEDAEFFDANNKDAVAKRENLAWTVLNELLSWLVLGEGDVGIFDATNTTDERRRMVLECALTYSSDIKVLFIESICDDPKVLEANLKHKVSSSPDFVGIDPEKARFEFSERIRKYEQIYRPIGDDSLSYIKVINLSSKVVCNKIHGRTQHRILAFLMSLHVLERPVWLVRPGPVDVDPHVYMGSCHPGVVAHQLQSPKSMPRDRPVSSPISPANKVSSHHVDNVRTKEGNSSEPPELILSEDEDDYWGSFAGTASWQRAERSTQHSIGNYSWPQSSSIPRTLVEDMAPCSPDSLNLVIPHPSADGASLNDEGRRMAERLGYFIKKRCQERGDEKPYIFTSTLPRAMETGRICSEVFRGSRLEFCSALNPVDVGACHGMTMGEIRQMLGPEQLERMRKDPCRARLPGGESQQDVTKRLEPFIVDYLERQVSPVIVISHLSTLQILYEYFLGSGDSKGKPFWALDMPVGTVIQLVAKFGGASAGVSWQETRFQLYDDSTLDHGIPSSSRKT